MTADDVEPERMNQFIVYGAFGEVMHSFQVFELVLWGFLTRSIKRGTSLDQAMERVERWNSTTLGSLWRGLRTHDHWPDGMIAEVDQAVTARNYLAHHFLREYFLVRPSTEHRENALDQLATIANRLDALIAGMEAHSRTLGIPDIDELDNETRQEIEALRPTTWLADPADEEPN